MTISHCSTGLIRERAHCVCHRAWEPANITLSEWSSLQWIFDCQKLLSIVDHIYPSSGGCNSRPPRLGAQLNYRHHRGHKVCMMESCRLLCQTCQMTMKQTWIRNSLNWTACGLFNDCTLTTQRSHLWQASGFWFVSMLHKMRTSHHSVSRLASLLESSSLFTKNGEFSFACPLLAGTDYRRGIFSSSGEAYFVGLLKLNPKPVMRHDLLYFGISCPQPWMTIETMDPSNVGFWNCSLESIVLRQKNWWRL